jgi:hypothetical protein
MIAKMLNSKQAAPANISIPVVVHIVYNAPEQNLDDSYVNSQIAVLNEGKSRKNCLYKIRLFHVEPRSFQCHRSF